MNQLEMFTRRIISELQQAFKSSGRFYCIVLSVNLPRAYNLVFDTVSLKWSKKFRKFVLKLFTTFIAVAAILVSPKHVGILPGVIIPVFIESTGNHTPRTTELYLIYLETALLYLRQSTR